MQISDLTVEVRNSSLARVGQILPADLVGFEGALRFNKVGSWKITLRSDHPLVDVLRAPGSGIIVTGPTGVLLSGPTASAKNTKTASDPTGVWEIVGTDDGVILGERLAYPVPTSASLAAQTTAYDVRTGKAETVAKAYVNANIGPSAPAARRIASLTVDTDLARGSTVVASARFDKLGELISSLLVLDGLGFDIRQSGSTLVFEVFAPVDRSASIRMDVDNLRLEKSEYTYQRPEATRVIVAGQGQGGERLFVERSSAASTTAESAWGRRIEVFKDSRNTADATELQNAGDEILAAVGKTLEGIKVTPSDDQTMRYGVDWGLGDKVTVVIGSTQVAQIVTEVAIVVTENGIKIGATVGEPGLLEDYEAGLLSATTEQSARVSALERNEMTSAATSGASVSISDTAPASAATNALWIRSTDMAQFVRYNDGNSTQWVEVRKADDLILGSRTTSLESRATTLESRATTVESRATALETADATTNRAGLVPIIPPSVSVGSGTGSVDATGLVTFTGATAISLNSTFTSTYLNYLLVWDMTAGSSDVGVFVLFRTGTTNDTSSYNYAYSESTGASIVTSGGGPLSSIRVGRNTGGSWGSGGQVEVYAPFSTAHYSRAIGRTMDANYFGYGAGVFTTSTKSHDGITITSGGATTLTGTLRVYGYRGA